MTEPLTLACGDYRAQVRELGAAVLGVRHRDRDLLFRVAAPVPTPPFAGVALAPWPNRIAGGRYRFGGAMHQLPIDEVERGNALHGLALWQRWTPVDASARAVTLQHTLYPRPGYPFTVELSAQYELGDDGLAITLTATNRGDVAAPVGLSTHPYFTVGDGALLDEWSLTLPGTEVIETDEQLLPIGTVAATSAGLDFTRSRPLGTAVIDHAFTGVDFGADGRAEALLTGAGGSGVRVSWDAACRWVQVYTLQAAGQWMHRRAVAIEPMTCAPDAFNSGAGLVVLGPAESTAMSCLVSAHDG